MEIYQSLEKKFESILSGNCLTSYREENKNISNKYQEFTEENFKKVKNDFLIYIKNYLILKKYQITSLENNFINAKNDQGDFEFLIDFDWSTEEGIIKIKTLDNSLKTCFSDYQGKYMFLISIPKGVFFLVNCQNLKKELKENKNKVRILTENTKLFNSQFICFKLEQISQKIKIFSLK